MNLYPYSVSQIKKNIKWAMDLNVRPKTIKLLKESMREKFCDLVLRKYFLDMKTKSNNHTRTNECVNWTSPKRKTALQKHC